MEKFIKNLEMFPSRLYNMMHGMTEPRMIFRYFQSFSLTVYARKE